MEYFRRARGIFLLIILLLPSVYATKQEVYSDAVPSDEGIYMYFSEILRNAESSLDKFLDEDPAALNLSLSLEHKLELTGEESRYYSARGIVSNVSYVLPPFTSLSRAIGKLVSAQTDFLENIEGDKAKARYAVMQMRAAVDDLNASLSGIEEKELWNGTSKLYFDISGLRDRLEEIYSLIDYYEGLLPPEESGSLIVVVSNERPVLYEEITIYVYARNVTPTFLFIDGFKYEITSAKKHSFRELGRHVVYATGTRDGNLIKSNTVEIYVRKILTSIVLSSKPEAFLNEMVKVRGILSDYHGNPLNENLTIGVDGRKRSVRTNNGFFTLNVTRASEGILNISAFYAGNETYESSNASISIFFSRFPISLHITASKTRISVNESVNFTGRVYGATYSIPIHISVNSAEVKVLNATEEFAFSLNFTSPGRHIIFAYFPGDSLYMPAESNKVEVVVGSSSGGTIFRKIIAKLAEKPYILAIIALILIAAYFLFSRRRKRLKIEPGKKVEGEAMKKPEEEMSTKTKQMPPESAEYTYDTLFNALIRKYNLKKSLTPRELLKELKNEPFAEKLKIVTELHEKAVYGGAGFEDKDRFLKLIAELLEVVE